MRVVLDTNVVVSGLISPGGTCGQILRLVVEGVLRPCWDERILAEYENVSLGSCRFGRCNPDL